MTTARKNLLWHSRVESTAHLRSALKNATLRPRGSSVLPPLAGTATGTTTSLTNHLHQPWILGEPLRRLGVIRSKQHVASACLRFGLVDRSEWHWKNAPLSTWTRWSFGLRTPLASWIGLEDAVRHIMHLCTAPAEDVRACTTWSRPSPSNEILLQHLARHCSVRMVTAPRRQ